MTKRILHIIPSLDRAGAEKQLVLLAAGLPRDQFDVHVCALTRGGPLAAPLQEAGISAVVLGKRFKADPLAWYRLRQHVARLKPDLVQGWMFTANAYARTAARAAGVPHVIAGERCVDRWKPGWLWTIDRRLVRFTDVIIANSDGVRDYGVEHGIPAEKYAVIPNGIEPLPPSRLSRDELLGNLGIPRDAKLIGAVGRLWPQKNLKFLIWVMELLHIIHKDVHLLIVGEGPQRLQLERYIQEVEAAGYMHLLGHRDDVPDILPHLDVFWQGSGYEGMPNAVMEAMAAGLPVVASDVEGNRDLVVQERTGYLCRAGDRAEFCRVTDDLINQPDRARQMGEAGRERVLREFAVERMVARHAEVYREVLE